MIEGLSHVTFIVSDLDRMTRFLSRIFGAEEVYASGNETHSIAKEKFFLIGGIWVAIMEGGSLPGKTYNHIAFKIPDEQFDAYVERVRSLGVEVHEGRSRVDGENRSLYFYDIEKEDWTEKVYKPDIHNKKDSLYKKPGYNPFE
jgi:catechol 2,3-dioxygenase-like lactoylglutathione lyase family enzyme